METATVNLIKEYPQTRMTSNDSVHNSGNHLTYLNRLISGRQDWNNLVQMENPVIIYGYNMVIEAAMKVRTPVVSPS